MIVGDDLLNRGAMRVASAKKAAGDTWAYYVPYLAAVGTPFLQYPASLTQPERGWQAQLVLTLPLYDGGMIVRPWTRMEPHDPSYRPASRSKSRGGTDASGGGRRHIAETAVPLRGYITSESTATAG